MRYRENREQTAELLRMVLPLMSRHAAGFHPMSYAVWYEYAAGTNRALKAAIDGRVAAGERLTDEDIHELFASHVAMRDLESSMRVRDHLQKVVEQVTEATHQASEEVGRYGEGLSGYQERLRRDTDHAAVADVVQGLLGETRQVLVRTGDLQQNLVANSRAAERLQVELETAAGQALLDPLTGLLSLRGLQQRLRDDYAAGLPRGGLLRVDVDRFNELGESYGHLLGDRVLTTVAQLMSTHLGPQALLARSGGEAFLALLPDSTPAGLTELAEQLRGGVERCRVRRQDNETQLASVTVSIGATVLGTGDTLAAAVVRAEQALARSRQDGCNRVTVSGVPSA